jgi:hypothetical protein
MDSQLTTIREEPTVGLMLQTLIEKGITAENVMALTQLCDLKERMDRRQAEKEFAAAFALLQSEMPKVKATKAVMNKDGTLRYKFAPYEEIMRQAQPFVVKYGFSVTFDDTTEGDRITATCTLMHGSGHSRSNRFACRIGSGPPGSSDSQKDGSASSYAKRYALCNCLNIIVERIDDDANLIGSPMHPENVKELRERVERVKADEAAFLKYAGAAHYEAIPAERYDDLNELLFKKEVKAGIRDAHGEWI